MKVHCVYGRKVGREGYGSETFSVSIESEPPAEVAQDRERLRKYMEEVFADAKARVEDQVVLAGEREPSGPGTASPSSRRPPVGATVRPIRRPVPQRPLSRGPSANGAKTEGASLKQVNYPRSLARDAGYSNDQLSLMAEEATGKTDLRQLTKREASELIDSLRQDAA
jgi:hypothetical protein